MALQLVNTNYVMPGTVIGQIIIPTGGTLPGYVRKVAFVGRGSRLALSTNAGILRSFIYTNPLSFPSSAPYEAVLPFASNGDKDSPNVRLYKTSGEEVRKDRWQFTKTGGVYTKVLIANDAFDPAASYYVDYQSTSRVVKDPVPVTDLREVIYLGNIIDQPMYEEYVDYYVETEVTAPVGDVGNTNPDPELQAPLADVGNTGEGSVIQATTSAFEHNYNRYYEVECVSASGNAPTRIATFKWKATPMSGGNTAMPPVPLQSLEPQPTFTINEANPTTLEQSLELGVKLGFAFGAGMGIDEVQQVVFPNVPDEGSWTIEFDGETTAPLAFNANAAAVQAALIALTNIQAVTVTGNYTIGFDITWTGADGHRDVVQCTLPAGTLAFGAVAEVATLTLLGGGASAQADYFVFTNQAGASYAVWLDIDAAGIPPTGAAYLAVPVPNRIMVSILSTDANTVVSAAVFAAISGTIAATSFVDNLDGTLTATQNVKGVTVDPVPHDAGDVGVGSIGVAVLPQGVNATPITPTVTTTTPGLPDDNFDAGDKYAFNAWGPGLLEKDARYDNVNQFSLVSEPVAAPGNTGVGCSLSKAVDANFTADFNQNYKLKVIAVSGSQVLANRTATFVWSEYGEIGGNSSFIASEASIASLVQTLTHGVKIDINYGAVVGDHFVIGDTFTIVAKAPKQLYQAKDDRNYKLAVSTASNPTVSSGYVSGTYVTNTPEGKFGTWEVTANKSGSLLGRFIMPDNVILLARNANRGGATNGNRNVAADVWTFSSVNHNMLDWSLTKKLSQQFEVTEVYMDVNGSVTGTPGNFYVIMTNPVIPGTPIVTKVSDGSPISFFEVSTNVNVIGFVTKPTEAFVVQFENKGKEPDPGQFYYMTSKHLRPAEFYNTPIQVLEFDKEGRAFLAPMEPANHLAIMNEIVAKIKPFAAYYIQVKDSDDDGIYTNLDFGTGIEALKDKSDITDVVVLSNWGSLSDTLASNLIANDPFEKRPSLYWFGMPIGTPIGDTETPDSLVYIALKALQVYGDSPAHGTRILVAPTWATKTIRLFDNTEQLVTIDGSFVAGAVAVLNASFTDPSTDLLDKQVAGFDSVQTYSEKQMRILGNSGVLSLQDKGGGVFTCVEDITVDTFASDFQLINCMNQKHNVTYKVRIGMDAKVKGTVVPNGQAGVGLIQSFLSETLITLRSAQEIADWQDDNGNVRDFSPDLDIFVFRDKSDPTKYYFMYSYFTKFPMKRMWGTYAVNRSVAQLVKG